ncbi:unnamed protein product [Didymodactylos carnosus]|uniref:Cyclic nucleotide-binding domain-containing protein n=1 Tax=Didymodactylos carnosus TaxID=1234261 RepID=A0A814IJ58_9BILA|nr:unnamed protein product [Didymodactylos carnosus]CAF1023459.1 unnamed protein product [Didymodactylos carnosus]CAF3721642.1 unnamed protein product [Didymodactylos carnosus]CAF3794759.1 unnamed protein product [Didymodactylos carnosus]
MNNRPWNIEANEQEFVNELSMILQDFAYEALTTKPQDINRFAITHFHNRIKHKSTGQGATLHSDIIANRLAPQITNSIEKNILKQSIKENNSPVDDKQLLPFPVDLHSASSTLTRSISHNRRQSIRSESIDPELTAKSFTPTHTKNQNDRQLLINYMKNIVILQDLNDEEVDKVLDLFEEIHTQQGEIIINYGDDSDYLFIVKEGQFEALDIDKRNWQVKEVAKYEMGDHFCELALLYNQKQSTTIRSLNDGLLWKIKRIDYRNVIVNLAHQRRCRYIEFLKTVPILYELNDTERMNIVDSLKLIYYNAGEIIIKQGDKADCMYFIENGNVRIEIQQNGMKQSMKDLGPGKYFGEMALIADQPRTTSAVAIDKTRLAQLSRHAFERLLGTCLDIMKRNATTYKTFKEQVKTYIQT